MSRRIRTIAVQGSQKGEVDTYFDRVVKFVPADIVGAWVAAAGIVKGAAGIPTQKVLWIVFVFGLLLTPFWTLRQTHEEGAPRALLQAGIATLAFAVWVFALGGPFASLPFYHEVYGSLVLIGFTLVVGLIVPRPSHGQDPNGGKS